GEESPPGGAQLAIQAAAGSGSPDARGNGSAAQMVLSTPIATPLPTAAAAFAGTPQDQGMDDESGVRSAEAAAVHTFSEPMRTGTTPEGKDHDLGTLRAFLQRRACLSTWLQRQAKRRVKEDLNTAGSPAQVALQLLAAHQLAAATGAAVAAGDPRLAMLIAR
ncbi:hypothetical protein VaNZ11_016624, partial [Volvox africanus]